MKDQDQLLRSVHANQRKKKPPAAAIGKVLHGYLDRRTRQLKKNTDIVDIWKEAIPQQMYEHTRLVEIKAGMLTIETQPGPYMHEMQLMKTELIKYLQARCGLNKVKKIIIRPASKPANNTEENND